MSTRKNPPSFQPLERRALLAAATQIDLSFGQGGYVYTQQTDTIYDMVVQSDGKLLAAGRALKAPYWYGDLGVARYNPDGSLDAGFGVNGMASVDIFGLDDRPCSIALLPDGKIIVAGEADTMDGTTAGRAIAVARFNANGTLDTSFGPDGKFTFLSGNGNAMREMAVTSSGAILIAGGSSNGGGLILRLTAGGALDATFANAGVLSVGGSAMTMSLQADGKFVTAGSGQLGVTLRRFNVDGMPDATYGDGGSCFVPTLPAAPDAPYQPSYSTSRVHSAIGADGKFVLSIGCGDGLHSYFTLMRFTAGGALDTTFSGDGRSDLRLGTVCSGMDVAVAPDGKIVQSGMIDQNLAAVRYNADGTLDTTFGYYGIAGANLGGTLDGNWGYAEACAVDAAGNVYLGGAQPDQQWFTVLKFSVNPTYTIANNGGILVRGTDGNDTIIVRRTNSDTLSVERNGVVKTLHAPMGVLTVVEAGAGDDVVIVANGVGPTLAYGGDGNDSLVGGDGNDSLCGNAGKDKMDGGTGDDRLAGNGGNDALVGGDGADRIYGDAGNDAEIGAAGGDRIWGGAGDDLLSGNGGNDMLSGEGGINTLSGGAGSDRLYTWSTDVYATGGTATVKLIDEKTGLITLIEGLV